MNDNNIRQAVAQGPLTSFQALAIALCIALNMLDGFDILAMSFSASGVKAAWNLPNSELGELFSAGLVGMAAGSLLLAPCADVFGRRRIILVSVLIAGAGMLGSVAARGFGELLALRALTGVGIGGTIASVAVVVSEYAPDRWRSAALAAYSTGYPVGATLGGALTALAIPRFGWRSAFAIGGVMTLALLVVAWRALPESLDFLLARRPPGALGRLNELLVRMRLPELGVLPEFGVLPGSPASSGARPAETRAPLRWLLTPTTFLVWVTFFCTMAAFYFFVSWTPRLLNAAGLSATAGLTAGVLLNLGGIVGCGGFAVVAARADARRLLIGSLIASALLIAAFGAVVHRLELALWTALLLGVLSNAAMAGLYAVGPPLYPTAVRATGMGCAIGIGRLGAILAPFASGALLDRGWEAQQLYGLFSGPFAIAAMAMLLVGSRSALTATVTVPSASR